MLKDRTSIFYQGKFHEVTESQQDRLAEAGPAVWSGHKTWDQVIAEVLGIQLSLFALDTKSSI